MQSRTTILLDERSRSAARRLAMEMKCSTSEAIRRAIQRCAQEVGGMPIEARRARKKGLLHWIDLVKDSDPAEEVARLKREDEGF